jgi:hypothetical protein
MSSHLVFAQKLLTDVTALCLTFFEDSEFPCVAILGRLSRDELEDDSIFGLLIRKPEPIRK